MKPFLHEITTTKSFDDAVAAIQQKSVEKGFRVLHTHDVAATLAEKGFAREPLKIIEVCNAKYASQVLNREAKIAVMLPCPISVYTAGGATRVCTMLPSAISDFFPDAGVEEIAAAVEKAILEILQESC
jgi:uncharacterized protein (DUF302 family)